MKKISTLLKKLATLIDKSFYFTTYTATGYDFTANQYRSISKTITARSGYTPIIAQVTCSNKTSIDVTHYYIDSDSIKYDVINRTSAAVSGANFTFKVLYLKTALGGVVKLLNLLAPERGWAV